MAGVLRRSAELWTGSSYSDYGVLRRHHYDPAGGENTRCLSATWRQEYDTFHDAVLTDTSDACTTGAPHRRQSIRPAPGDQAGGQSLSGKELAWLLIASRPGEVRGISLPGWLVDWLVATVFMTGRGRHSFSCIVVYSGVVGGGGGRFELSSLNCTGKNSSPQAANRCNYPVAAPVAAAVVVVV